MARVEAGVLLQTPYALPALQEGPLELGIPSYDEIESRPTLRDRFSTMLDTTYRRIGHELQHTEPGLKKTVLNHTVTALATAEDIYNGWLKLRPTGIAGLGATGALSAIGGIAGMPTDSYTNLQNYLQADSQIPALTYEIDAPDQNFDVVTSLDSDIDFSIGATSTYGNTLTLGAPQQEEQSVQAYGLTRPDQLKAMQEDPTVPKVFKDSGCLECYQEWLSKDGLLYEGKNPGRSWVLGNPDNFTIKEEPLDNAGKTYTTIYGDKVVDELQPNPDPNDATHPFILKKRLVVVEMMSGKQRIGLGEHFESKNPASINVAGDQNDKLSPTYATWGTHASLNNGENQATNAVGQPVTKFMKPDGTLVDAQEAGVPATAIQASTMGKFYSETGHNVAGPFLDFMNTQGPMIPTNANDFKDYGSIFGNPIDSFGYPVSEPYWFQATIDAKPTMVLGEAFQRGFLTNIPTFPDPWKTQLGNVGQHYYGWRYKGEGQPATPPTATPRPTDVVPPTETPVPVYEKLYTPSEAERQQYNLGKMPGFILKDTVPGYPEYVVSDPSVIGRIEKVLSDVGGDAKRNQIINGETIGISSPIQIPKPPDVTPVPGVYKVYMGAKDDNTWNTSLPPIIGVLNPSEVPSYAKRFVGGDDPKAKDFYQAVFIDADGRLNMVEYDSKGVEGATLGGNLGNILADFTYVNKFRPPYDPDQVYDWKKNVWFPQIGSFYGIFGP